MTLALCLAATVVDADTLRCANERVRVVIVDACETRGPQRRTGCTREQGITATNAMRGFIAGKRVTLQRCGQDQYRRTLARVYVNDFDVGAWLMAHGHAVAWYRDACK